MTCEHCAEWKTATLPLSGEAPTYVPIPDMRTPSVCPLCHGNGTKTIMDSGSAVGMTMTCNACYGRGIVWPP